MNTSYNMYSLYCSLIFLFFAILFYFILYKKNKIYKTYKNIYQNVYIETDDEYICVCHRFRKVYKNKIISDDLVTFKPTKCIRYKNKIIKFYDNLTFYRFIKKHIVEIYRDSVTCNIEFGNYLHYFDKCVIPRKLKCSFMGKDKDDIIIFRDSFDPKDYKFLKDSILLSKILLICSILLTSFFIIDSFHQLY